MLQLWWQALGLFFVEGWLKKRNCHTHTTKYSAFSHEIIFFLLSDIQLCVHNCCISYHRKAVLLYVHNITIQRMWEYFFFLLQLICRRKTDKTALLSRVTNNTYTVAKAFQGHVLQLLPVSQAKSLSLDSFALHGQHAKQSSQSYYSRGQPSSLSLGSSST